MAVKLRKPVEMPVVNGADSEAGQTIPLPPMQISGVVVSKDALIAALRPYLPGICDIEVVDDGSRFVLTIGPVPGPDGGNTAS